MIKKVIEYTDYNGVEKKEEFFFNLSKTEITKMQFTTEGGLVERIQKALDSKDAKSIMLLFDDLIMKSYGEKSLDGKRFMKSEEISEAFAQTDAYDKLFMELCTDDNEAAAFVNGIIPKDIAEIQPKTNVISNN